MKSIETHSTDLSAYLGLLSISGPDALKLLQGQFTCDVSEISPHTSCLTAQCNPQGRIIVLGYLCYFNDRYLFSIPKSMILIALNALKKYAIFFKVNVEDVTLQYHQFGVKNTSNIEHLDHTLLVCISENSHYLGIRLTSEKGSYSEDLQEAMVTSLEEWKHLNIISGIPSIYPETCEKFLPHDLNLPKLGAVNFKKGCYTGQEIIARMEYRGKPKNRLYRAESNSVDTPSLYGDIFLHSKPIGNIVDFTQIEYNRYELLVSCALQDPIKESLTLDLEQNIILQIV